MADVGGWTAVDLVLGPARWLAGPAAALLGADGATPQQRRAELLAEVRLPGADVTDLGLRHLARAAVWFVLAGLLFGGSVPVLVPASLWAPEPAAGWIFAGAGFVTFLPFFLASVHLVKLMVAHYLPEHRWNPHSRLARAVLLAQTPDLLIAVPAAAAVGASLP